MSKQPRTLNAVFGRLRRRMLSADLSAGSVAHGGTDDASQRRPGPAAAAEALRLPVRPLGDYVPGGRVDAMRRLIGGR